MKLHCDLRPNYKFHIPLYADEDIILGLTSQDKKLTRNNYDNTLHHLITQQPEVTT